MTGTAEQTARNPHAGFPFTDDDAEIAAALEDVSIPALLCSLVHMTGDPAWIRSELRPQGAMLNEYQGYMSEEMLAEARRRALPAIAAFRDGGCVLPAPPPPEVLHEMMEYLGCAEIPADVVEMFLEDLHMDGSDAARSPGATRSPPTSGRARTSSWSAAARPASSPASGWGRRASPTRSSRRTRAPAARGGTTSTRAPGSTSAATSTATRSSPATTGPSTSRSSPSSRTTATA